MSIGIDRSRANVERWAREQPIEGLRLYCCCGIEWLRHAFGLYRVDLAGSREKASGDRSLLSAGADELCGSSRADAESGDAVPRVFVYIDAPYLISSRRSKRAIYEHEMTDEQHAELLDTASRLPCDVMISHYPHQLYEHCLGSWRTFTFQAPTRSGRNATEQVWCNYAEPTELHDARYVGTNKRQRERVRRRVRNWVNGLARMTPDERQAVLDAIDGRYIRRLPRRSHNQAARSAGETVLALSH